MPKFNYLISLIAVLALAGCAHQPVSLAEIQLAQAQLAKPEQQAFRWAWEEHAISRSEFADWLQSQPTGQLIACICLPPNEQASPLLMQGWQNIQPLIDTAERSGFGVEVELKTTFTGPELVFRAAQAGG